MLNAGTLPRFVPGAPLHTQLTAERLNALRDAIVSNEVKPGRGMLLNRTAGGVSVTQRRDYGPLNPAPMPFEVYLSNPATPAANIRSTSRFYAILGTSATSITDLTTEFTLANNTYVWLQVTVSSLAVTAVSRQTGTAWPSLIVTSGSPAVQTQFNVPIGKVTASNPYAPGFEFDLAGTIYHFEQCLFSHLLVENRAYSGTPIIYAFPWCGA
jgi:hypothetical protein